MRISDWSSDVCSSDLRDVLDAVAGHRVAMPVSWIPERRVKPSESDEPTREIQELLVIVRDQLPVYPTDLVVLAVGVVVAVLTAPEFVAGQQKWRAVCEDERCQHVPFLTFAQFHDRRILGRPFHAVIPAVVGVVAVMIALAVRLVVLVVVGSPVVQREAVRSEEHTSELQSLLRTSFAASCLQK